MDPYAYMLGSPFEADQPNPDAGHTVTIVRNDPQMPGKPCAFFLDCTCGWGVDYVSDSRDRAQEYADTHERGGR